MFVKECVLSQSGFHQPPQQLQVEQVQVGRLAESVHLGIFVVSILSFLYPLRNERATAHRPTLIL